MDTQRIPSLAQNAHYIKTKIAHMQGMQTILQQQGIPQSNFITNQTNELVDKLKMFVDETKTKKTTTQTKDISSHLNDFAKVTTAYLDNFSPQGDEMLNQLFTQYKESLNQLAEQTSYLGQENNIKTKQPTAVQVIEDQIKKYLVGKNVNIIMTEKNEFVKASKETIDFIVANICSNITKYATESPIVIVGHNHTKHYYPQREEKIDSYIINITNEINHYAKNTTSNNVGLESIQEKAAKELFDFHTTKEKNNKYFRNELALPIYQPTQELNK
ncbi:hypothetical protein K9M74_04725 [Candidatus Woesearchaeota archaeon]|nr:hypothetical protein [Candidatus Woesearchaeota archaeon]